MAQIVKIDLDGPGSRYVNSRLEGGGVISRCLLHAIGSVNNAFSPLPDEVSCDKSLQFEHGGVTTQKATLRWLASEVATKFPAKTEYCFLVEDSWAKPTDSSIYDKRHRVFISGDSVIYALPGEEFDETGLKQLLKSITSFEYTGFVASCQLFNTSVSPSLLKDDVIADFAKHIRLVVVSAFDREGLVISEVEAIDESATRPLVAG